MSVCSGMFELCFHLVNVNCQRMWTEFENQFEHKVVSVYECWAIIGNDDLCSYAVLIDFLIYSRILCISQHVDTMYLALQLDN